MGISIALNINKSLCAACEFEIKKQNEELKEKLEKAQSNRDKIMEEVREDCYIIS